MSQQQQQIKVNIHQDALKALYSDVAFINLTPFGVTIEFGKHIPQAKSMEIIARVSMSPQHAKILSHVLVENVQKYEKQFGEIKVTDKMKKESKMGFDE